MNSKLVRFFMYSGGALLLATGLAKIVSSFGSAPILQTPDPILQIPYQYVFWIVGTIELVIAVVCFCSRKAPLQAGLLAWLTTAFILYRVGLVLIDYHKPCACLGNLTDALHITAETVDWVMKVILAYLLIGSYAMLTGFYKQRRKTPSMAGQTEANSAAI